MLSFPIVIEVGLQQDIVRYSRKVVRDIDMMIQETGIEASEDMWYCHECDKAFKTEEELKKHRGECSGNLAPASA
jgi:hypothetical protein